MLDSEIYGMIIALGILLAMFLVGVFCITVNVDNIKLRRKYRGTDDEAMSAFVGKETAKGLALIILELALAALLLLVKSKFLS